MCIVRPLITPCRAMPGYARDEATSGWSCRRVEKSLRETKMPLYESVFIARQDISAPQVDSLTEELTKLIEEQGAKVVKMEYWGLRSLAYKIRKNRKGHYVLYGIDGPSSAILEMERRMRLNEDVLRYLTVKVDEIEEGPSVMMQRGPGRDDRPGRDNRPGRDDRPRRDGGHGRHNREDAPQADTGTDAVAEKADSGAVAAKADTDAVTAKTDTDKDAEPAKTSTGDDTDTTKTTDGGET